MGDEDSETFIEGQLILLRDLISMLHGPVIANLKPSVPKLREARWKSTASILATMEEQRKSDQCYLVQALEIIRVNGFVRRIFADELEQALQKAAKQTGQGSWGSHAFLLVGTKLLAIYSQPQAPDLNPSDLFLLGLYVQVGKKRLLSFPSRPHTQQKKNFFVRSSFSGDSGRLQAPVGPAERGDGRPDAGQGRRPASCGVGIRLGD